MGFHPKRSFRATGTWVPKPLESSVQQTLAKITFGSVTIFWPHCEERTLVYCAEFKDNPIDVGQLHVNEADEFQKTWDPELLGGAVTLQNQRGLKLIPYYLYSNRGRGWMQVWMRRS